MIESIQPTFPDDAMIYVSCDGPVVEIQADNRDDIVTLHLNEQQTVKLIVALQQALQVMRRGAQQ